MLQQFYTRDSSYYRRARILFEVVKAIREVVSPKFRVYIKINTADIQTGYFNIDYLYTVIEGLNSFKLNLLELSGENVIKSPVMITGSSAIKSHYSTTTREAFPRGCKASEKYFRNSSHGYRRDES